jgi:hypothetical protein
MYHHLRACDAREAAIEEANAQDAPKTRIFHLVVKGSDVHWLHVEVSANASLQDLDEFLRDTWVECCGHLSQFTINDVNYTVSPDYTWFPEDRHMDVELGEVLYPKLEFSYEYDFGSTTYLELRVAGEREGALPGDDVVHVMARNQLPDYRCEECCEPATVICVFCNYTLLCDECLEKHECGEEGVLPVVNSPRIGVCGYTGDAW